MERFAGRWALLRRLGHGGAGDVFLARDLTSGIEVALKRLKRRTAADARPELLEEFELLARIRHPAVVRVHELGFTPDGEPWYTMEFVPGAAADRALPRGDWGTITATAARVAHGLEALHREGIAHGDLKPSNLLVVPGPAPGMPPAAVRLVDFGLATLLADPGQGYRGTPGYTAPEVVAGGAPDVSADLYALGATLYALTAGRGPFPGRSVNEILSRQRAGPPPAQPLEDAGAPPALVRIVMQLLAPEPRERPASARAVRRDLEAAHPAARWPLAQRLDAATLVGRERESSRLDASAVRSGRSRIAIVTGDSGSGKSLLLETAGLRGALAGAWVARLSCAGFEAAGAVARALLLRLAAEAGEGAAGGGAAPGAASGAGGGARSGAGGGGDAARAALRERLESRAELPDEDTGVLAEAGVAWALAIAAGRRPLVVLLDDAEQLDPRSREILLRIALHPTAPPSLWAWARRSDARLPDEERALVDAGRAELLPLRGLTRSDIDRLAEARLLEPAADALVEFLWTRADGHPGLTIELLRAAAASAAIEEAEGGLALHADKLDTIVTPTDFQASLLARLERLPEGPRVAAAALAALGRASGASRVAALDPRAEGAGLDALVAAGLATRDEQDRVTLAPPALGPLILARLGADERRALHARLAAEPGLGEAERFRHLAAAGDAGAALAAAERALAESFDARLAAEAATLAEPIAPARAAAWLERVAVADMGRGRYDRARPLLERALELERAGPARAERWARLSTCVLRAASAADVERVVRAALAEALSPRARSIVISNDASRLIILGDRRAAGNRAREALAGADEAGDDEARGHASLTLAAALHGLGEEAEALAAVERAEAAYRRAGLEAQAIRSVAYRSRIVSGQQEPEAAERLLREAVAAARAAGARLALEEVQQRLAVILTESGQWTAARAVEAEILRGTLEDGRPAQSAITLSNLSIHDGLAGRHGSARRYARAALTATRRWVPSQRAGALRARAQAERVGGRLRAAERVARASLGASRTGLDDGLRLWCVTELGHVLLSRGRPADAFAILSAGLESRRSSPSLVRAVMTLLAGRAQVRLGDTAAARARLAEADAWLGNHAAPWAHAQADQLRAEIAIVAGESRAATESAARALDGFAALPAPPDRAEAALEFARLALEHEDHGGLPIGDWLEQAAALFDRFGNHRGREQALSLLVGWLPRAAGAAPARARERDLVGAVSRMLSVLPDLATLTRRAMQLAVEQLGAERGVLLLTDPATGKLEPFADHGAVDAGTRREAVSFSRRVVQKVAERGRPLLIGDAPTDPAGLSESMKDMRLRSIVCVPLFFGGRVLGAVYLDDSRRADLFGDEERSLLEGFAQLMAAAIENSRGHEEVRRANEALVGENLALRQEVTARYQPQNVIAASEPMQRVLSQILLLANADSTVLLTGENGTGKDLLARLLHHNGPRRQRPFVHVDCGAIPESLLESELFGIMPNVATGVTGRDGKFLAADGGTLFLNEIGEMPLAQQVRLLNAISNREITPVGGTHPIAVDVRIVAATNQDLPRLVDDGRFRKDLYFRINVFMIEVPPLRERKADIPALVHFFASRFARDQKRPVPELSAEFLAALMQSDWPGNVRELQNYVERVITLTPGNVLRPVPPPRDLAHRGEAFRPGHKLSDTLGTIERKNLADALERAGGNQSLAARMLGVSERSIRYKLRKYGLRTRQSRRTR